MILTIDIGNSNITLGGFEGERLIFSVNLSTDTGKTADEYASAILGVLAVRGAGGKTVRGGSVGSSVGASVGSSVSATVGSSVTAMVGGTVSTGSSLLRPTKISRPATSATRIPAIRSNVIVSLLGFLFMLFIFFPLNVK